MILFDDPRRVEGTTFAEPDTAKSYTRRLLDSASSLPVPDGRGSIIGAGLEVGTLAVKGAAAFARDLSGVPDDISSGRFRRIAAAAWDQQTYVETSTGRAASYEASYDRIIDAVTRTSGVQMQNPLRGGYSEQADLELRASLGDQYRRTIERSPTERINAGVRVFQNQLQEYIDSDPRVRDAVGESLITFNPEAIARRADEDMQRESSQASSLTASLAAGLAGGIIPAMRDPINAIGLFLGAGPSAARSVAGRVTDVAIREALINAGVTGLQQPFVQDWRREAGLQAGVEEGAKNVAMAAGFGAAFGAGAQGLRELLPRAATGDVSVRELRQALDNGKVPLSQEDRLALKAADEAEAADLVVMASKPKGLDPEEAETALRQAVRRAEDPDNEPPAALPAELPPVRPDQQRLLDPDSGFKVNDVDQVGGRPVTFQRFDPRDLQTDAATMQYKGNSDAAGVTDRLKDVRQWGPLASGRVFVFERLDGARIIADGHQRLGLAKRAIEDGQDAALLGHVFREADGWSALDVRALAAKKNLQEGSGTALDAARVLRDRPDLADDALPKGGTVVRDGLYLSRLSDEAFGIVNAGVVSETVGARVGAMALDPATHVAILNDLIRFRPETQREIDMFITESQRAGFVSERQEDMFGVMDQTVSLMGERVKVLNDAVKLVASDKRLFAGLDRNAERIETAGNQLARGSNEARARDSAQLQDILVKMAQRFGPVSDALNRAALALKEGAAPATVAKQFVRETNDLIEANGLTALLQEPQLRPSGSVAEPGTPQALAQADAVPVKDDLTFDMFGGKDDFTSSALPEAAKVKSAQVASDPLLDAVALPSRDDPTGTRLVPRAEALAEIDQLGFSADLVKACKT